MNRKIENLLYVALAAVFGAYVVLRAWLLPMTVDESTTTINHVPRMVFDTLMFSSEANPNNHIINTLAIKLFTWALGWHPIVVRLPVLIGAAIYAWAGFHLTRRMSGDTAVKLFAFAMLLGNPYLLEFFSLARGYGLAAGLLLAAMWQAWRFLEENQGKHLRNAFIFAGLAVYANFTLLVFFAPFVALLLIAGWQPNASLQAFWGKARPALIALFVFIALWFEPLRQLAKHPEIEHWNALGSLFGSMELSVKAATMNNAYLGKDTVPILTWLTILFSLGIWLAAVWRWWRRGWRFDGDPTIFTIAVFPGAVLTNVIQVYLTKTPYLEPRLALFYWPLFALQLGVAATWLRQRRNQRAWLFMAPLLLFTALNLSRCVNLVKSSEWWFDQATYKVLDHIRKDYETGGRTEPFILDAHHVMLNSYIFHIERDPRGFDKYVKMAPWHGLQPPGRDCDYYYAINTDEVKDIMDAYEIVMQVPDCTFILLKKKR